MNTQIITHRGLDPSNSHFPPESSFEAFSEHIKQGFSLEFDPNFTKDGVVIWHDPTLSRLSKGTDNRSFLELTTKEVLQYYPHLCSLDKLLQLISESQSTCHALHLKGNFHSIDHLKRLSEILSAHPEALQKLFAFDIPPHVAKQLKQLCPELQLAPSVAHPYDIKRFNPCVYNTLQAIEQAIEHKELYSWVWLDEWDRTEPNNSQKALYTSDNMQKLSSAGYKIALVTPELHATSPHLLGGESHPDAEDSRWKSRIQEIIQLSPDAMCTDHPSRLADMFRASLKEH